MILSAFGQNEKCVAMRREFETAGQKKSFRRISRVNLREPVRLCSVLVLYFLYQYYSVSSG